MSAEYAPELMAFVLDLREQGVSLSRRQSELVCDGPPEALTDSVVTRLRADKQALLELLDAESVSVDSGLPIIAPAPEDACRPFPLTDNQRAYWVGRSPEVTYGGVGIHVFFELEAPAFDLPRLERCWNVLLERHPMLRAQVTGNGMQEIAGEWPLLRIREKDFSALDADEADRLLGALRDGVSHRCYALEELHQAELWAVHMPGGRCRLLASQDGWCADGLSVQVMVQELAALYHGEALPPGPGVTFRDYVLAEQAFRSSPTFARSLAYWKKKVRILPPAPALPMREDAERRFREGETPRFVRHSRRLPRHIYASLETRLRERGLSLPAFLLSCYAEMLGHWSEDQQFTVNVPWSNRLPVHPDVNRCVGEFASTTLIRADTSGETTFAERAEAIRGQLWTDMRHCHVSGLAILWEWRQAHGLGPETLLPYIFTSEPEADNQSFIASLERLGTVCELLSQTPQVWLDAQYNVVDGELYLSLDAVESMFVEGLPALMFETYADLAAGLAEDPRLWESPSPIHRLSTSIKYSEYAGPEIPIADLELERCLESAARQRGGEYCLADAEGDMTWSEARQTVRELSGRLVDAGLAKGACVALLLEKGRWQSLAPLAVLLAGGTPVPLAPESPPERILQIAAECPPALILTDPLCREAAAVSGLPHLTLGDAASAMPALSQSAHLLPPEVFTVIHTSGSTGVPKGVLLPRKGLANLLAVMRDQFDLSAEDAVLSLSPNHHDMFLPEFIGNMFLGMRGVYPDPARRKDPAHWANLLRRYGISFWHTVPAMVTMLMDYCDSLSEADRRDALSSLKIIGMGGDRIPLNTVRRLFERAPSARIFSLGGPTEITVWNVMSNLLPEDAERRQLPYGKPIHNAECRVTDSAGRTRPLGVTGEMRCLGPFLSLGYIRRELNSEAFASCPDSGRRVYATGDMVRMRPDGTLVFVSRKDNQVKISGYRVEPGEIEHRLLRHEAVSSAVVLAGDGPGGLPILTAWVCPRQGESIGADDLRRYLSEHFPQYMVPARIGVCEAMPITGNGKIDRRAVAAWPLEQESRTLRVSSLAETALLRAWESLLGTRPSSGEANFFASGGDSIAAIRLVNKLTEAGYPHLNILTIFRCPSFGALAGAVGRSRDAAGEELPPLTPAGRHPDPDTFLPATSVQRRIWVDEQLSPHPGVYTLTFRFAVRGSVSPEAMSASLRTAMNRHEALRTVFSVKEGEDGPELYQRVLPEAVLAFESLDWRNLLPDEASIRWDELARDLAATRLDMVNGPLTRAVMAALPPLPGREAEAPRSALILAVHHAVFDAWSMQILLSYWEKALRGLPLEESAFQYGDFARWEDMPEVRERMLRHAGELSEGILRLDPQPVSFHPVLADPATGLEAPQGYRFRRLEASLAERLRHAAARESVTPFIMLLSAFSLLAAQYTGTRKPLFGTFAAQRFSPELETVVGMLVNPLPLAVDLTAASSFRDVISATHEALMLAKRHELAPFEEVTRNLQSRIAANDHALFSVSFSQDNTSSRPISAGDVVVAMETGGPHSSAMDLEISLLEASGLALEAVFSPGVVSGRTVDELFDRLILILEQTVREPNLTLAAVQYGPQEETLCRAPDLEPIHNTLWDWFACMAGARPDMTAIRQTDGPDVTYSELLAASLGLHAAINAHLDGANGKDHEGREIRIALFLPRGPVLLAAMLAVWRMGAVAIPISVNLPGDRVRELLRQSKPGLTITDTSHQEILLPAVTGLGLRCLLAGSAAPAAPELPAAPADPDRPAIILFTSGSTGEPKGVALSGRGLLNRLAWGERFIPVTPEDSGCSKTDVAFGDFFCELFSPLLHGFPLTILPEERITHADALFDLLLEHRVTRLVAVPSLLRELAEIAGHKGVQLCDLRHVTSSGEPLSYGLVDDMREAFPRARFYNIYGSVELTCDAVWFEAPTLPCADRLTDGPVPIGRPLAGAIAAVRDYWGAMLAHGFRGELTLGGLPVALGYLDAENGAILPLPQGVSLGRTSGFATGDLALCTREGFLLCLGRNDRQCKIRGQRIAPQEIEARLLLAPEVRSAAVIRLGKEGDELLVACLTGDPATPSGLGSMPPKLRERLGRSLPTSFIPSLVCRLEDLPRTRTGKTDYRALERIVSELLEKPGTAGGQVFEGTAAEEERKLAAFWSSLLPQPPSRDSHFFHEGGNSLKAVRLAHLIEREFSIPFGVRDIYAHATFDQLARLVERAAPAPIPGSGSPDEDWMEI